MKVFAGILLLMAVLSSVVSAQDALEVLSWNAGAAIIENADGSYGQAYLETVGPNVYVYFIEHVLDWNQTHFWVTIPWIVEDGQVSMTRVRCEGDQYYEDSACFFTLSEELSYRILSGEFKVAPYVRQRESSYLQLGQFVGSPRPDTGKWTIYSIVAVNMDTITLEAVYLDLNPNDGKAIATPMGNFCRGRSGAPVVPVTLYSDGSVTPLTFADYPISLGELKSGLGEEHPDYVDPTNLCALTVTAIRPQS